MNAEAKRDSIRRELARSSSAVRLLFLLDGLPNGISPGHAGCTPVRALKLSALGIVSAVDWRPPSGGRIPRRWLRLVPNPLGTQLVAALSESFRQRNLGQPARGVDALYLLPTRLLKEEAKARRVDWMAAVDEAIETVLEEKSVGRAAEGTSAADCARY